MHANLFTDHRCVILFLCVNFCGWSQLQNYFNSEIFPIYGILLCHTAESVHFHMQVNTLQVVLTTDGERSFTFFIYSDIQWGEGVIGFNAGDGVRSYTLPDSGSPAAIDIEEDSNVGVEGVYAHRVDLPEIVGPGGESNTEGCCIDIHTTEPLELCNGGEDSSRILMMLTLRHGMRI